jgi:hypothetical protein
MTEWLGLERQNSTCGSRPKRLAARCGKTQKRSLAPGESSTKVGSLNFNLKLQKR